MLRRAVLSLSSTKMHGPPDVSAVSFVDAPPLSELTAGQRRRTPQGGQQWALCRRLLSTRALRDGHSTEF